MNLRVTGRAGSTHVSATIAPLRDGGGEIVGAICSLLRQPDQQLQSDFEDFFTHASVPMHLVGADGRILRANRAELELLGYSPEEYIGRHIATFHADQAALDEILCRLHAGERLEQFPARLRARDGTVKEVLISSSPRFVAGRFSNTRCVTTDVTEQRRLDREARESERLLHELMNALPVAIYTTDADGRITFFNEASAQFAGRRPALGDMWCVTWKLFHPDGRPLPHDQCRWR
ncbi:PAS domain-containing protein [Frateuria hangzhouensis]|uniref:PAS domain-containing protein n=1 Tax=Frateuria hangzhouensis TaxID=2995589 RepID=UPI002260CBA3|nr:PAS domain S-box protein [Frateuria sp. STR12]MCX7513632.1 PAS domain S-box protein [Frateuria sp. STR12]